jgi:putative nucleotidyltransferase with HDIG domain
MFFLFREKNFYHAFIVWFIIILWYFLFLSDSAIVKNLRESTQDFFAYQSFYLFYDPPEISKDIVIIAIDENSRNHLDIKWPWPRRITAQLLENIVSSGPKVIGVDVIFSGESSQEEDIKLEETLNQSQNIILAYRLKRDGNIEFPLGRFRKSEESLGFINKVSDERGVLKYARTFHEDNNGDIHFSMDMRIVSNYLGFTQKDIKVRPQRGVYLGEELFISSPDGIVPINFLVHPEYFKTIPAYEVLEGKFDPSELDKKIVLIGATDPIIHDEHLTPLGVLPGVTIIANTIVMILSDGFVNSLSFGQNFFVIILLGIFILLINRKFGFLGSFILTATIFIFMFSGFVFLRGNNVEFNYFDILLLSFLSYAVFNIYKYIYLLYMNNKLKNLAIIDNYTGLYTRRYLLLKINQQLQKKKKDWFFIGVFIENYRDIVAGNDLEKVKNLISSLAERVRLRVANKFIDVQAGRFSQDVIGFFFANKENIRIEDFLSELIDKVNSTHWQVNDKDIPLVAKGIGVQKPAGKEVDQRHIVAAVEDAILYFKNNTKDKIYSVVLEKESLIDIKKSTDEGFMGFLTKDLEERNKDLEKALKEVIKSREQTEQAYFDSIRSLIKALEEKDTFTQGHSERVAEYALKISKQSGFSKQDSDKLYKAALLHDIGKIGIPDYILRKKEKLTDAEYSFIRRHSTIGVDILKPVKVFKDLLSIILYHHERLDGTGYPYGLSGEMIPKEAQALAVADAFDAITSGRGYKKGKTFKEAIRELKKATPQQYNSEYVKSLEKALNIP